MNFLNVLSKILAVFPVVMFLYDAVKSWFVDANFKIRTFQQWWMWASTASFDKARPFLAQHLSSVRFDKLMHAPGPLVMLVPPLVIYGLYRFWFSFAGGKDAGGIVYKSRH